MAGRDGPIHPQIRRKHRYEPQTLAHQRVSLAFANDGRVRPGAAERLRPIRARRNASAPRRPHRSPRSSWRPRRTVGSSGQPAWMASSAHETTVHLKVRFSVAAHLRSGRLHPDAERSPAQSISAVSRSPLRRPSVPPRWSAISFVLVEIMPICVCRWDWSPRRYRFRLDRRMARATVEAGRVKRKENPARGGVEKVSGRWGQRWPRMLHQRRRSPGVPRDRLGRSKR